MTTTTKMTVTKGDKQVATMVEMRLMVAGLAAKVEVIGRGEFVVRVTGATMDSLNRATVVASQIESDLGVSVVVGF